MSLQKEVQDRDRGAGEPGANRPWLRVLKNLVALMIITVFAVYLWEQKDELVRAFDVAIWHVLVLCFLIILSWFVNGFQTYIVYRAANLPVSVWEGIMLTIASGFGNYLPMRAGTIIRGLYLKQVYGLRLMCFGGITGIRTLLTITAAGVMGLIGLGVISFHTIAPGTMQLTLVFLLLMIVPLVLMTLPVPKLLWLPTRAKTIMQDLTTSYDTLRRRPIVALQVVLLLLTQYLILGLRFIVSADALGVEMSNSSLLLMAPLAALMSFMAITPGGLGLREAVMGYVSLNLGFSFAEGVFIGTIDRAILLAMVAVFGGVVFFPLWKNLDRGTSLRTPPTSAKRLIVKEGRLDR